MKYPTSQSTFTVVPLDDEYSMNALWALVRNLGCTSTEIYIEQVPINFNENVPSSAPFMQSFTGMMEHLSQFDRPHSQMFTPVSVAPEPTSNVRTESSSSP